MKNNCKHINKKNLSSNKVGTSNVITVQCIDCNYIRYETRYKEKIETSTWFKKN